VAERRGAAWQVAVRRQVALPALPGLDPRAALAEELAPAEGANRGTAWAPLATVEKKEREPLAVEARPKGAVSWLQAQALALSAEPEAREPGLRLAADVPARPAGD
jgi:hypothetical protein